ncbi:copper resistance protein CopC [Mycobacterium sp. SMC-8]|uniref:copper resistance CopC family protein n=1 Tax=Mycobacterium sp. SMC-8 TaxID=2857060 RepID=UPI0021B3313D|nr:copper resistance CopC family protein [Mycobacterium sp. SMC-8]UXA13353.1 copper resistance protein CopC [Mycobacterium sp. SMC-8]
MTVVQRAMHALLITAVTFGLAAGALGSASTAWAHAARIASDPGENAELELPPSSVNATFNEPMQSQFAAMTVVGPDGALWSDGDPTVNGAVIGVAVRPGGPAGEYTVNYRATSADGHVVTGSWSYRVRTAAPAAASPTAEVPDTSPVAAPAENDRASGSVPVWPFVVAAVALVAAGALWAVRRRS